MGDITFCWREWGRCLAGVAGVRAVARPEARARAGVDRLEGDRCHQRFWLLGIRAFLWEPETLEVRRVEVASRTWSGPPLRIGVISDTHTDGPHMGMRGSTR